MEVEALVLTLEQEHQLLCHLPSAHPDAMIYRPANCLDYDGIMETLRSESPSFIVRAAFCPCVCPLWLEWDGITHRCLS